jgi:hypothetical protein
MARDDALRGRWLWKAMPWGLSTACSECGEFTYCYGRSRERMVCLACFEANGCHVKLRRAGQKGERATYTYRSRRPKREQVERAKALRAEGKSISQIHFELGVSKRTVTNYLSASLPASQSRSQSGLNVTRKEDGGV